MESNNWRVKRDPSEVPAKERTPVRSYQQRRTGQDGNSPYGPPQAAGRSPIHQDQSRDTFRKPVNDEKAEQAIEEGRRVYVGNMPYEATVRDVESLFKDIIGGVQAINMSVDPMTGRNPSYCFVDFTSKDLAERVMEEYNGRGFLRRPLKVKPGVESGTGKGRFDVPVQNRHEDRAPLFDRWNRNETPDQMNSAAQEGRRLYVGGLPRFQNQPDSNAQIRDLFESAGFKIEVISKVITRHESLRDEEGNFNYCFVDLKSAAEADAAIAALDGMEKWGWKLRVNLSRGTSGKVAERRRLFVGGLPEFPGQEATEKGVRELFEQYQVKTISKLFLPSEEKKIEGGNHHYCFVELATEEQTDAAIKELDWKEIWGWKVRVKPAKGNSQKAERPTLSGWGPSSRTRRD